MSNARGPTGLSTQQLEAWGMELGKLQVQLHQTDEPNIFLHQIGLRILVNMFEDLVESFRPPGERED